MTNLISKTNDSVYNEFLSLVAKNYMKEHELGFYAEQLGFSTRQLNNLTTKNANRTPKSLIDYYVIYESQQQLAHTKLPVSEISERLGFKSQVTFCRLFKRVTGYTPTEYRHNKAL